MSKPYIVKFYKPDEGYYDSGYAMGFMNDHHGILYVVPTGSCFDTATWPEFCVAVKNESFMADCETSSSIVIKNWGGKPGSQNLIHVIDDDGAYSTIGIYKDFASYKNHYGSEMA